MSKGKDLDILQELSALAFYRAAAKPKAKRAIEKRQVKLIAKSSKVKQKKVKQKKS